MARSKPIVWSTYFGGSNDDDAIGYYERCMNHPPIHMGLLMNLGILYEDGDKYEKAVDCYRRILHADPNHEQAKLFLKDASAFTKSPFEKLATPLLYSILAGVVVADRESLKA